MHSSLRTGSVYSLWAFILFQKNTVYGLLFYFSNFGGHLAGSVGRTRDSGSWGGEYESMFGADIT